MKRVVLSYMAAMKKLGELLMRALVQSLGLEEDFFRQHFEHPTQLFRMFHYPPHDPAFGSDSQGVGEHTDYGYLTILKQDLSGGLQVKRGSSWIDAKPIPNSFIINLGDAIEHNTGGLLLATPHRVVQRVNATASRYSFPYFYDPSFSAVMQSIHSHLSDADKTLAASNRQSYETCARWDTQDPSLFEGTYGDYLLKKVAKVFPLLAKQHKIA